jgi:aminobenzoyl-glutamate transport protein
VNPLSNWYFTAASSFLIIGSGGSSPERVIEPRLKRTPLDGDGADMPKMEELGAKERRGLFAGLAALFIGI